MPSSPLYVQRVPITDYQTGVASPAPVLANPVGMVDTISATRTTLATLPSNAIGMVDAVVTSLYDLSATITDSIGLTDAATDVNTYSQSIVDPIGTSDPVLHDPTGFTLTDTEGVSDSLAANVGAQIVSAVAEPDYGSGSNYWFAVAPLDGWHFLRMYSSGTAVKARIGTMNASTGAVTYGAESSLLSLTATQIAPALVPMTSSLVIVFEAVPDTGNTVFTRAVGLTINLVADTVTASVTSHDFDVAGSTLSGSTASGLAGPFSSSAFFGTWRDLPGAGRIVDVQNAAVTDADTMTVGADQTLVSSQASNQYWKWFWIDPTRTVGLATWLDFTTNAITARVFTATASGTITPQGSAVTVSNPSATGYLVYSAAEFVGRGAVVLARNPSDATQVQATLLTVDFTTYAITVSTAINLTVPNDAPGFFGARAIDRTNVLLSAMSATSSVAATLSLWIAHYDGTTFSMGARTDKSIGIVGESIGEPSIIQMANDYFILAQAAAGSNSCFKIKVSRPTDTAFDRGIGWFRANTGPRVPRTTTISSAWTSAATNQVVNATKFTNTVSIVHSGVQFVDCEFITHPTASYTSYFYPTFTYCEFDANMETNTVDVPAVAEGTIDHCNVYRCNKIFQVRGNQTVTDSWLHDHVPYASPADGNHRETMITNGQDSGSVVLVQRSWLDPIDPTDTLSTDTGLSGTIQLFNDFGTCHHWTVDSCYLGCGNNHALGSYTTRWGYKFANGTDPHHIVVTNNAMWASQFGIVDGWFRTGTNVWTNNIDAADGSGIAEPATHLMF